MKFFKFTLLFINLVIFTAHQASFAMDIELESQNNLISAIKNRDLDLARNLLESLSPDEPSTLQIINQVDEAGKSSLILAIQGGSDFDIFRRILARGADVNQADAEGKAPLFYAAQKGQLALIQDLLKKGANINYLNTLDATAPKQAWTALTQSLVSLHSLQKPEQEQAKFLNLFIENKAQLDLTFPSNSNAYLDPRSYDRFHDRTLLTWAIESRFSRIVDYLLNLNQQANKTSPGQLQTFVNQTDGRGRTPLIQAAEAGELGLIRTLLDNGAKPDQTFPQDNIKFHGRSLVAWAIANNRSELVSRLQELGADLGPLDSLLMSTVERGNLEMVKLAVQKGAPVCPTHSTHLSGHTPLSLAAERGNLEIVRLLLDSVRAESAGSSEAPITHITKDECDLNTPGKDGRSALAWTANLNVAQLLLDKGENQYFGASVLRTVLGQVIGQSLTPNVRKWIELFSSVQTTSSLEGMLILKSECMISFENAVIENHSAQFMAIVSELKNLMILKAKDLYYQQREREILNPSGSEPGAEARGESGPGSDMEIDPLPTATCLSCSDPSPENRQFGPAGCECYLCPDCGPAFCDMVVNRDGVDLSKCSGCNKPIYSKYLVQQGRTEAEAIKVRNRTVDQLNSQQAGWHFCPTQGCAGGRVVQPFEKSAYYSCFICGHEGCIKCGHEHQGECSNYAKEREEFETLLRVGADMPPEVRPIDPDHADYLKGAIRPCYHCGVITERIDGCNHITCKRCKKDWHWNNGPYVPPADHTRGKMTFVPLRDPHF